MKLCANNLIILGFVHIGRKRTRHRFKWVLSISIVLFTLSKSESDIANEESDVAKKWVRGPFP